MAVDLTQVAHVEAQPGDLPPTMAAWVIRQEREGAPSDAMQVEEIEVPEPGADEVIVRVMAAGVNYNGVWAALGKPVSVFQCHPDSITTSPARTPRGSCGGWVPASRAGSPATRSSCTATKPPTRTPRATASIRWPRTSRRYGATRPRGGSFAQFSLVQAQQLLAKPEHLTWEEAASYGLTYFTTYRMLLVPPR